MYGDTCAHARILQHGAGNASLLERMNHGFRTIPAQLGVVNLFSATIGVTVDLDPDLAMIRIRNLPPRFDLSPHPPQDRHLIDHHLRRIYLEANDLPVQKSGVRFELSGTLEVGIE